MSFFKKIFKAASDEAKRQWTKRAPRVRVVPLHRVSFMFTDPAELKGQTVTNISLEGIGFERQGLSRWPERGSKLRGSVLFHEERFPVELEIMYVGERLIGCRFRETPTDFRERVLSHFFAEFAAVKLSEVKTELLQEDPDGTPHFFIGENGCELFFVEKGGALVHFHLAFFGNYIEGDSQGRVRLGMLEDEERGAGTPGYKGSAIVRGSQPISPDLAAVAVKFLTNVHPLEPSIREALAKKLLESARERVT